MPNPKAPADSHTNIPAEPSPDSASSADSQNGSAAFRAIKTTGKWAGRAAGFDVLWRDGHRLKPRNPELWKDIFSSKGWKAAAERAKAAPTEKIQLSTLITPIILCGFGLAIACYALLMIVAHPDPFTIPTLNKIVIFIMLLVSLVYVGIYFIIWVIQIGRFRKHKRTLKVESAGKGSMQK